jgi:hypothetical protein
MKPEPSSKLLLPKDLHQSAQYQSLKNLIPSMPTDSSEHGLKVDMSAQHLLQKRRRNKPSQQLSLMNMAESRIYQSQGLL